MSTRISIPCTNLDCDIPDHKVMLQKFGTGVVFLVIEKDGDDLGTSIQVPAWVYSAIEKAQLEQEQGVVDPAVWFLQERLAKADARILDLETRVALRDVIVVELTEERDELRKCVKERDATGYDEAYARQVQIEKEVAELKEKLVEAE